MKIELREPQAPNLDSLLTPEEKIILRCVECQTFMLPKHLHMFVVRFRDPQTRQVMALPVEICPYCYDRVLSPEVENVRPKDVPRSYFIAMDRFQYDQTIQAERWGLKFNLETNKVESLILSN